MVSLPLLLMFFLPAAQSGGQDVRLPVRYVPSVSFRDGKCQYWTGDAMFDGEGFRRDLRRRFDRKSGLTIYHTADLPSQCVTEARGIAAHAGFTDIRIEVGRVSLSLP